jgi:hypothetical protein
MRKAGVLCSLVVVVVVTFLGGWALTYPSDARASDPGAGEGRG